MEENFLLYFRENLYIILLILAVNTLIIIYGFSQAVGGYFGILEFQARAEEFAQHEFPSGKEFTIYYMILPLLLIQLFILSIHVSLPLLIHFRLRRAIEAGKWDDVKVWIKFIGRLTLTGAFGLIYLGPFGLSGAILHISTIAATGVMLLHYSKKL